MKNKKVLGGILSIVLVLALLSGGNKVPDYSIASESPYVRDGQECKAYRIVVDAELSEDDLRLIYDEVTSDDGKYLHTVWFYKDKSETDGPYTVGQLEELEEDADPVFTKR